MVDDASRFGFRTIRPISRSYELTLESDGSPIGLSALIFSTASNDVLHDALLAPSEPGPETVLATLGLQVVSLLPSWVLPSDLIMSLMNVSNVAISAEEYSEFRLLVAELSEAAIFPVETSPLKGWTFGQIMQAATLVAICVVGGTAIARNDNFNVTVVSPLVTVTVSVTHPGGEKLGTKAPSGPKALAKRTARWQKSMRPEKGS